MAANVEVLVCDTAEKAKDAKEYLEAKGYEIICNEQAGRLIYDGETYSTDGSNESLANKWIVIGRR